MFTLNTIQEIIASLKHNKLRTILTGLSVSWGIFILIILMGAGNGLLNGVMSNFNDSATNTVLLWSGKTSLPYKGLKSGRNVDFSEKVVRSIDKDIPETGDATGVIEQQATITYKNEYGSYNLKGVEPIFTDIWKMRFEKNKGRFINQLDLENNSKVIVIDRKIEQVLFKGESALGKYVKVGSIMFQVIGINAKDAKWGGDNSYIPFTTAQIIYNPNRKFQFINMTVDGLETKEANDNFNNQLKNVISKDLQFDPADTQALWVQNGQEQYIQTMKIFGAIQLFIIIIGIFTLIAGIVGVSNIMLVSVKERTREIGIRKAIGASPSSILGSVILESIIITTIFGYIGMMLGIGLTELVNYIMLQSAAQNTSGPEMSVFKNPTVELSYVFTATAILIIAGIIAGYVPARRAVRIKPIEAMREE